MERDLLLLPVVAQVFLVVALYVRLAMAKSQAAKAGLVNETRRALYDDAWPESVLQINNCIRNQFEVPVLFFVLTLIFWMIDSVSGLVHILAWSFVLTRLIHAYIHTGSNYVPIRRRMFMMGCLVIMVMAIVAVANIVAPYI